MGKTELSRERPDYHRPVCGLGDESGLALIVTLLVVVLIAALIATAVTSAMNGVRTTNSDYRNTRTFYAAEAGAEKALADIELAIEDGYLSDEDVADIQAPTLNGFNYLDFRVEKIGSAFVEPISDGPFNGLYSLTQRFEVHSRAEDGSGAHSSVILGGKAQAIPIFQFGYFFEGAGGMKWEGTWHGYGRMHSNRGLYFHGCDAHFHDILTTPGKARIEGFESHRPRPGGCNPLVNYIDNANEVERLLDFDSEDTPDPEQFKAKSDEYYDNRLMTEAYGVDSLRLPLPEGVPPRQLIEPRSDVDGTSEQAVKFAWKADMYVTVDLTALQDADVACDGPPADPRAPAKLPTITVERNHGYTSVPSPAMLCRIFRFRWESFYDNHEKGWVDVLDLDLAELRNWVQNPAFGTDGTEIIYVEFRNAAGPVVEPTITDRNPPIPGEAPNVTLNNQDKYFPVLKLVNGSQLHGPLTVGSEYTVYVQGDYNSGLWYPAAVYGDLIGFLSNAWDDVTPNTLTQLEWTYNASGVRSTGWNCRFNSYCPKASVQTTQYFAYISSDNSGIQGCYHEDPSCAPAPHTRMGSNKWLEAWRHGGCSSRPGSWCLHFWRGSYVVLYPNENGSPYWNYPGNPYNFYYGSDRDWGFDPRFQYPDSLPPGTPLVGAVLRASFKEIY